MKNLNLKGDLMDEEKKKESSGLITEVTQGYIGDDLEKANYVYEKAKKLVLKINKVALILMIATLVGLTAFSILNEYCLDYDEFTSYKASICLLSPFLLGFLITAIISGYSAVRDAAKDRIKQIEYHHNEMMEKEKE